MDTFNLPPWLAKHVDMIIAMALQYAPRVLVALFVLWLGFWLTNMIVRSLHKALHLRRVSKSLGGFLGSVLYIGLKILVLMTVANILGVQMTSFIALLGAAGLAIGLSLQGSLGNLAGGILILFFKPFEIGEEIEVMNHRGVVESIEMFTTVMRGADGTMVFLPNGPVSNGVIVNHSRKERRIA